MSVALAKGKKGVLIKISADGDLSTEGVNFTKADGRTCKDLSDEIIRSMGGTIEKEEKKPEYAESRVTVSE